MKDLSQLLFLSCWGLASATWLRSCDIQSGEGMIIAQLNELSFGMPLICLRTSMYVQEGTRFRNGSQWYLCHLCRLPFAIFMCDRVAKNLWHPDLELEDKEEKGEEVPVEQAIVSWTPPVACFWGVIRWSNPWGPRWSCWALPHKHIKHIQCYYSCHYIVFNMCKFVFTKHLSRETERETNMCFFPITPNLKVPRKLNLVPLDNLRSGSRNCSLKSKIPRWP